MHDCMGAGGSSAGSGYRGAIVEHERPFSHIRVLRGACASVRNEAGAADPLLAPLQAAACTYRIALGRVRDKKILMLQPAPPQEWTSVFDRCVSQRGFSLYANIYCVATDRGKLERPCRYISLQGCRALRRLGTNSNSKARIETARRIGG